jgi:hypothetical protein
VVLRFFAAEVDADVVSSWSDERGQDVHEVYVRLAAGRADPSCGLCLLRELDAPAGPGRFAGPPMVGYADREPTDEITRVHLARAQLRVAVSGGEEVVADFELDDEAFQRIRRELREIFSGLGTYTEERA